MHFYLQAPFSSEGIRVLASCLCDKERVHACHFSARSKKELLKVPSQIPPITDIKSFLTERALHIFPIQFSGIQHVVQKL